MSEKGRALGSSSDGDAENPQIAALLASHVITALVAPAACAGYANEHGALALGGAGRLPGGLEATGRTIFDLASVSKPIVACALSRLVERGLLDLSAPLARVLPELAGTRSAHVPLELLLAHRAGLDGHRALFAPVLQGRALRRGEALRCAADARRPDCAGSPPPEGFPPLYSDLGYVLDRKST